MDLEYEAGDDSLREQLGCSEARLAPPHVQALTSNTADGARLGAGKTHWLIGPRERERIVDWGITLAERGMQGKTLLTKWHEMVSRSEGGISIVQVSCRQTLISGDDVVDLSEAAQEQ